MKQNKKHTMRSIAMAAVAALGLGFGAASQAAVTIVINNLNAPGEGFNDPTPAVPVGGNAGVTVGAQRLIAFTHAANIWGAKLTSATPIVINASFDPLACTATGAVLGSAGATQVFRDFTGAQKPTTWYSYALANKLFGAEIDTTGAPQINSRFNSNIGTTGCLETASWYYGLDSNEPAGGIDFVAVLLHEMGHGLGFQTFTNGNGVATGGGTPAGGFFLGFPAIWDHYLFDATNNVTWNLATPAQRVASAVSVDKLVWTGLTANAAAPSVLITGDPGVAVSGPAAGPLTGTTLAAGEATFGAPLTTTGVFGEVMPVNVSTGGGQACAALSPLDAISVAGKIALLSRGGCGFTIKVKNAQNAGAIGVIVHDNVVGSVAGMGGTDATVTIPSARITLADGNAMRTQLTTRSRGKSGVFATLGRFGVASAGTDALGRLKMFAPSTFQPGSSVSHYDTSATRNLLMEPSINADLTQSVEPPIDLTLPLFTDIGW